MGQFLAEMAAMTVNPLSHYDSTWQYLTQTMVEIEPTTLYTESPEDMVEVPASLFMFEERTHEILHNFFR